MGTIMAERDNAQVNLLEMYKWSCPVTVKDIYGTEPLTIPLTGSKVIGFRIPQGGDLYLSPGGAVCELLPRDAASWSSGPRLILKKGAPPNRPNSTTLNM